MLKWAVIFAVIALIAGALGFTGVAAGAAGIAKILFVVFLVLFVGVLLFALLGAKAVSEQMSTQEQDDEQPVPRQRAEPARRRRPRLRLDEGALEAAKRSLEKGAVTPSYGPWREDIIKLLNDALATEIVCTLRYKRHYYTAKGLASPTIAEEFLVHAQEETAHSETARRADRAARRRARLLALDAARAQPRRLRRIARTCRP